MISFSFTKFSFLILLISCSVLVHAMQPQRKPIVAIIDVQNGAIKRLDMNGILPEHDKQVLHILAVRGKTELLATCLDHGAIIDLQDLEGRTPLYSAVQYRQFQTAQLLLQRGANPLIYCNMGVYPIDMAPEGSPMHRLLQTYGGDLVDNLGWRGEDCYVPMDCNDIARLPREFQIDLLRKWSDMSQNRDGGSESFFAFRRAAVRYGFIRGDKTHPIQRLKFWQRVKDAGALQIHLPTLTPPLDSDKLKGLSNKDRVAYLTIVCNYLQNPTELEPYGAFTKACKDYGFFPEQKPNPALGQK